MSKNSAGRLPDFLLIGAMKAGSTSLAHDLGNMPEVFVPSVKEPHFLCKDEVLTPGGRAMYARLFASSRPDQICGEGSTGYSKLPHATGVPARARQVLGTDVRIVYIVRHPVERALSQHYHMYRSGQLPRDPDEALRKSAALVQYGRYMYQLRPWLDAYGPERIHVVVFEEYVADSNRELAGLRSFLRLPAWSPGSRAGRSFQNRGEDTIVPRPWVGALRLRVTRSSWYKVWVHPRLPHVVRRWSNAVLSRPAPERPPRPSRETLEWLRNELMDDAEELRQFLGRPAPLWSFNLTDEEPAAIVPGGTIRPSHGAPSAAPGAGR